MILFWVDYVVCVQAFVEKLKSVSCILLEFVLEYIQFSKLYLTVFTLPFSIFTCLFNRCLVLKTQCLCEWS